MTSAHLVQGRKKFINFLAVTTKCNLLRQIWNNFQILFRFYNHCSIIVESIFICLIDFVVLICMSVQHKSFATNEWKNWVVIPRTCKFCLQKCIYGSKVMVINYAFYKLKQKKNIKPSDQQPTLTVQCVVQNSKTNVCTLRVCVFRRTKYWKRIFNGFVSSSSFIKIKRIKQK